jgi:hypothetical protein
MLPETFARLVRRFMVRPLEERDLVARQVGKHLVSSKLSDLAEYLVGVLQLASKEADLYGVRISYETASRLMVEYGLEGAEAVVASILSDIDEIRETLGYDGMGDEKAATLAVDHLVNKIIPACRTAGRPLPRYFLEFFEERRAAARLRSDIDEE